MRWSDNLSEKRVNSFRKHVSVAVGVSLGQPSFVRKE
jgi:hypothetical protein